MILNLVCHRLSLSALNLERIYTPANAKVNSLRCNHRLTHPHLFQDPYESFRERRKGGRRVYGFGGQDQDIHLWCRGDERQERWCRGPGPGNEIQRNTLAALHVNESGGQGGSDVKIAGGGGQERVWRRVGEGCGGGGQRAGPG